MNRNPLANHIIKQTKTKYPTISEYYSDTEIVEVVSRFGDGVLPTLQNTIYRVIDKEVNHRDYPDEPYPI